MGIRQLAGGQLGLTRSTIELSVHISWFSLKKSVCSSRLWEEYGSTGSINELIEVKEKNVY